jgi:hypothetical protein
MIEAPVFTGRASNFAAEREKSHVRIKSIARIKRDCF